MKLAVASGIVLGTLLAASPVNGQEVATTFDELRRIVRLDESISVTDSTGATHKGRLASLSPASLQLRVIGFAVGATPVALVGGAASASPSEVAAVAAGYGTIGLLSGLLIDVVNKQTIPIYIHAAQSRSSRIRLEPLYSSGRLGLQLIAAY